MIDFNIVFSVSDQPITCPKCGSRTEFYDVVSPISNEVVQVHICLSSSCMFKFVVELEEEFEILTDEYE